MFGTTHIKRTILTAGAAVVIGIAGLQIGATAHASGAAQAKTPTVTVVLRDFSITMSQHRLAAGRPIRFVIQNRGKAMHETVLERAGAVDKALEVRGREYEADDIAPGSTRIVTWTVPRAGAYQLACHMPGHFEMGMKTSFTIRGS